MKNIVAVLRNEVEMYSELTSVRQSMLVVAAVK